MSWWNTISLLFAYSDGSIVDRTGLEFDRREAAHSRWYPANHTKHNWILLTDNAGLTADLQMKICSISFFCFNLCGTHTSSFFLYPTLFKWSQTSLYLTPVNRKCFQDGRIRLFCINIFNNCSSMAWCFLDIKITGTETTKPKLAVICFSMKNANIVHFFSQLEWISFYEIWYITDLLTKELITW